MSRVQHPTQAACWWMNRAAYAGASIGMCLFRSEARGARAVHVNRQAEVSTQVSERLMTTLNEQVALQPQARRQELEAHTIHSQPCSVYDAVTRDSCKQHVYTVRQWSPKRLRPLSLHKKQVPEYAFFVSPFGLTGGDDRTVTCDV